MTRRICLALDLHDDPAAIAEYERWHQPGHTPPAILQSIRDSGIAEMEIFRIGNRLVMVVDAEDGYSPEAKAAADAANPTVVDWEARMHTFQRAIPGTGGGWTAMESIFRLTDHDRRS